MAALSPGLRWLDCLIGFTILLSVLCYTLFIQNIHIAAHLILSIIFYLGGVQINREKHLEIFLMLTVGKGGVFGLKECLIAYGVEFRTRCFYA